MSQTTEKIKGNWNEIKGKLKQEYGNLTDEDLHYVVGQEEELFGRIQRRIGRPKEELENLILRTGRI
ncbi:CsbD family protein [Aquiflexum lacus]|uniref:CsbD family protein n=1 Tax=Aquiflexum lacus TaxID=2483805 RepID=UPI0018956433|nr:CsbD family protein [Aquiflexum lacus]